MPKVVSVTEADVAGKRVLLRTSLNTPIDESGKPADLTRLRAALPTLRLLVERGAKVVVVGYLGRSGDSLEPVVKALSALAPEIPMRFFAGLPEEAETEVQALKEGECLVLENIRRHPGEEKNDEALVDALARLADVFVSDAFAEAHRAYASNVGVAKKLPAYIGLLMAQEVARLTPALTPPKRALAVIGGAKFETKEPLLLKLMPIYQHILLGGALANDMLKARGMPVGASMVSSSMVPTALAEEARIFVPTDTVVFDDLEKKSRSAFVADVRATEKIVDLGPRTSVVWSEHIDSAPFVVWNGPVGVYEQGFTVGTDALAKALADSKAQAVVGGGDTLTAVSKFSFDPDRVFLSTGGGAMLEFLTAGTVVGVEALKW